MRPDATSSTTQPSRPIEDYGLLRAGLGANALFSTACAVPLLVSPASVSDWTGLDATPLWIGLGAGLLAFAASLVFLASRPVPPERLVRAATAADFLWVAGTVAILVSPLAAAFSERGLWILLVVAQFVLLCGVVQALALRHAGVVPIQART